MPTILIVLTCIYLIGMPIFLRLTASLQKKLIVDRAIEKAGRNANQKDLPKPIWGTWKECISFAMKNKRPTTMGKKNLGIKVRLLMLLLWVVGLLLTIIAAIIPLYTLLPISYLFFIFTIVFAVKTSKPILEERKKVIQKMFIIGNSKGLISNENADNPTADIKVLEWGKDEFGNETNDPKKVEYKVRTEFSNMGEEAFLQQFNQVFGSETAWVPTYDEENDINGWDYQKGLVTINAVPPLPRMAPFDEHYVLGEGVAWSFFPIALGVEGGLELPNPNKDGQIENVLGFDLSENQPKAAKKAGLKMSEKITTSPMVLCAGGTGGGKSLSVETIVEVRNYP